MKARWPCLVLVTYAATIGGCDTAKSTAPVAASASGTTVNQVCDIAATLYGVDRKQLQGETTLGDLGADELDFVELAMELEEHFEITIPDEAAERVLGTDDWKQGMKNVTMAKLARLVDEQRASPIGRTRRNQRQSSVESQAGQIKVYLNPLVILLTAAEKQKGSPLSHDEVLAVRDNAAFVMMSPEQSQRFYDGLDSKVSVIRIDPDRVWEEWQALRKEMR